MKTGFIRKSFLSMLAFVVAFSLVVVATATPTAKAETTTVTDMKLQNSITSGKEATNLLSFNWAIQNPEPKESFILAIPAGQQGITFSVGKVVPMTDTTSGKTIGSCSVVDTQTLQCTLNDDPEILKKDSIIGLVKVAVSTKGDVVSSPKNVDINYTVNGDAAKFGARVVTIPRFTGDIKKLGSYVSGSDSLLSYTVLTNIQRKQLTEVSLQDVLLDSNTRIKEGSVQIYERYLDEDMKLELDANGKPTHNRNVTKAFDITIDATGFKAVKKDTSKQVDYSYVVNFQTEIIDPTNEVLKTYDDASTLNGQWVSHKSIINKKYIYVEANTKDKGSLEVTKVDSTTNKPLAAAVFSLVDEKGKEVARGVTDESGKFKIESIKSGSYKLVEVTAPKNYILNKTETPITITPAKMEAVTITNEPAPVYGKIQISKVDGATEEGLAGAEFEVRDSDDHVTATLVSDVNGLATTGDLAAGDYTIIETKAPEGYILSPEAQSVNLSGNSTQKLKFINFEKKGTLEVKKVDEATGAPLAGAEFDLIDLTAGDVAVAHLITDANGMATAVNLSEGKYDLVEVKAPSGYVLNEKAETVKITAGEKTTTEIKNKKEVVVPTTGSIEITKVDKKTDAVLSNAEFVVKNEAGSVVAHLTTNAEGKATAGELKPGNYTVTEIKAPEGYVLNTEAKAVEVKDGEPTAVKIQNAQKTGTIEVVKVDSKTWDWLPGASFDLYDSEMKYITSFDVNEDGFGYVEDLPFGTYYLVETKAPEGYLLNPEPIKVTVSFDCTETKIEVPNEKIVPKIEYGSLQIQKVDAMTQLKLAGAEFDVIDANGAVAAHVITDVHGLATVDLQVGTYTLKETKAPIGYELNTAVETVKVTKDEKIVKVVQDEKTATGTIKIVKKDDRGCYALAGAEFDVIDANGNVVSHAVTNAYGVAVISNLPVGTYTLKETKAPEGYKLSDKTITVTVTKNDTKCVIVYNERNSTGSVKIIKKDYWGCYGLAGAEFDVIDASGNVVSHTVTDAYGYAYVKNLPVGTYTLKETKAPYGYKLSDKTITVTVTKNDTRCVVVYNEKDEVATGSIKIVKKDYWNCYGLAGAEFDVYDANGKVVAHVKTDCYGYAYAKNLPVGTYTLKETKAPYGYKLSSEVITVKVTKNDVQCVVVYNKKKSFC